MTPHGADHEEDIFRSRSSLLLTSMLTTPASAQNREHQQMTADLRMLQEQTQQLAITLAASTRR